MHISREFIYVTYTLYKYICSLGYWKENSLNLAPDIKIGAFPLKFPWSYNVGVARDKAREIWLFSLIRAFTSFGSGV